jgi:Protein of unknown function (DUF2723)
MHVWVNQHAWLIISGFVTLCVGGLYLSIAPTRLTNANFGGDAGDFLSAALTRGIPHPTGYPTYTLLGILFQCLPISTPVFRGVLESLLPAALGAGLLTWWLGKVNSSKSAIHIRAAVLTGVAFGVSPLLFSQAVIVEVHGLQSLFAVLALWWITLNLKGDFATDKKWIFVLAFLFGSGIGNHLVIILFAPVVLLGMISALRQSRSWKFVVAQLGFVFAGALVYAYLPIRALDYPPINWGNPQTLQGFLWLVTGNPYQGILFNVDDQVIWERIRSVANILLDQFGALGLVAGAIGVIQYSFSIKGLRWVLVWTFAVYFAFAIIYKTQDSIGYLIPAMMVFAVWIGLSLPALGSLHWKRFPVGMVLIGILVISMCARIPGTRHRLDPRLQDQPARFTEQFLQEAPPDAIVVTSTDGDTFPLWYYHFGLKERTDLRILALPLTQFVWYQQTLVHTYPDLVFPELYTVNQPNPDWGQELLLLNPSHPYCNTWVTGETETGVAYICTSR